MNTLQYSEIARGRVIKAVFPTASETQLVPGLPAALAEFVSHLDIVETLAVRQAQRPEVILEKRREAMAAMEETALSISGRVASYAHRTDRFALELDVRLKAGELRRTRLEERVRLCQHVCDVVAPVIDTLVDSGVTAAEVEQLQKQVGIARDLLPALRTLVVDKANATEQLPAELRALNEIRQRQIEPLMIPLEKRAPALYAKYRSACQRIEYHGGRADDSAPVEPQTGGAVPAATAAAS